MTVVIKAIRLKKEFTGTRRREKILAVDNISLEINKGEIYGFLGPNGAGKTTTIKMLVGLCIPDSGSISIMDHQLDDSGEHTRVGYLPEEHLFYPHLKVRYFLSIMAHLSGVENGHLIDEEVDRAMTLMEISKMADEKIGKLSKGQRQKVALAQAFLADPDLVFLDEPSSGLDPLGANRLSSVLKELKKGGMTIFFSSHQLAEVEFVSDRIGLIKDGKLILEGNTSDLVSQGNVSNLEELFLLTYTSEKK